MSMLPASISDLMLRAGGLAAVWWIISGGAVDAWLIGLPVVLIAAYVSAALKERRVARIHWFAVFRFLPFFLAASVRGGMDVARRAYSSHLSIAPGFLVYPMRLPEGAARVFFANSVSLLPGTLGSGIQGHVLRIHVLDTSAPIMNALAELERKVAAIFGIDLNGGEASER